MTELVLKVDDRVATRFKEISRQNFQGNDTLTLESLLTNADKEMSFFENIVEQIQDEIQEKGGITEKELEACIADYRQKKITRGKERESSY